MTGAAGFIGYHISNRLLKERWSVIGLDSMSNYYDVSLKQQRESMLLQSGSYRPIHERVESPGVLRDLFEAERPDIVIHLAGQAGVRYSIENPRAYLESNINGTFELLEAARAYPPKHMLLASSSSTYGANEQMPYKETEKADHQMSFYAATKKSTENIAHSYSHLFGLSITMFRFFTVYGPWGRPDMALFKFTKAILKHEPIDIYNHGEMIRDFTYVDDLVEAVWRLVPVVPKMSDYESPFIDSLSPVAPFRIVNIGNSKPEKISDLIIALEHALDTTAEKNYQPIQAGDIPATWADTSILERLIGSSEKTTIKTGIKNFVSWYLNYYQNDKYR